jgi:hypothetical protein
MNTQYLKPVLKVAASALNLYNQRLCDPSLRLLLPLFSFMIASFMFLQLCLILPQRLSCSRHCKAGVFSSSFVLQCSVKEITSWCVPVQCQGSYQLGVSACGAVGGHNRLGAGTCSAASRTLPAGCWCMVMLLLRCRDLLQSPTNVHALSQHSPSTPQYEGCKPGYFTSIALNYCFPELSTVLKY